MKRIGLSLREYAPRSGNWTPLPDLGSFRIPRHDFDKIVHHNVVVYNIVIDNNNFLFSYKIGIACRSAIG